MSIPPFCAAALILSVGPTRIGTIRPAAAASTAPRSEVSSQGCATTVLTGGSCVALAINRSYLACGRCPGWPSSSAACAPPLFPIAMALSACSITPSGRRTRRCGRGLCRLLAPVGGREHQRNLVETRLGLADDVARGRQGALDQSHRLGAERGFVRKHA